MSESARVSKGDQSEQDAGSPPDLMAAVERRFGVVQFDLAAHAGNRKHARYFAPKEFIETFDPSKVARGVFVRRLMRAGAHMDELEAAIDALDGKKGEVKVPNHDAEAFGLDAFKFDWSYLTERFGGVLYDNPEFSNIDPWAEKHALEAKRGANSVMLTPLSLGSNWWQDICAGVADTYVMTGGKKELARAKGQKRAKRNGRVTFVGSVTSYPKDTMVSHFHPKARGEVVLWDWRSDLVICRWRVDEAIEAA
jgi:hypothetical protein